LERQPEKRNRKTESVLSKYPNIREVKILAAIHVIPASHHFQQLSG
jgi:hypothetical protein